MISLRLESDFFQAALERLASLESDDMGVRFAAELRVEQLQEARLKMRGMRGQNGLLRSPEGNPERQTREVIQ
jgi:hypothetical protein